jgi:hypothetical protein
MLHKAKKNPLMTALLPDWKDCPSYTKPMEELL